MRSIPLPSNGAGSPISCRSRTTGATSPRARSSPIFSMSPASRCRPRAVFGNDVGAVLVWSGTTPRKLLGFFPARISERRYGLKLPVLVGWTHPYGPLGTPLVEREAAEPVIAAWLAHIAGDPSLPGLVLLPLVAEDEPFAAALGAILQRTQMPCADFARHHRALLAPRSRPLALSRKCALGAPAPRIAPQRTALVRCRRAVVHGGVRARRGRRPASKIFSRSKRAAGKAKPAPLRRIMKK